MEHGQEELRHRVRVLGRFRTIGFARAARQALVMSNRTTADIESVVSRRQVTKLLPDDSPKALAIAAGLGAVSSSCTTASSVALDRHPRGADGARLACVGTRELARVRKIALALPGVSERMSHGAPCFFIRDKRPLCYYHDNHRSDRRISLWCPAPPGVPEELVGAEPERFFEPTPSGGGTFSNWQGVYLDGSGDQKVDWGEVAAIVEDAYRVVAPKALIAELDRR